MSRRDAVDAVVLATAFTLAMGALAVIVEVVYQLFGVAGLFAALWVMALIYMLSFMYGT